MDSRWLKTQFTLHPDKTKAGLAAALGLEPPAISKILNGHRQIKAQEYIMMRLFFGLPLDGAKASQQNSDIYILRPLEGLGEAGNDTQSEWTLPGSILSKRTQAPPEKIKIFEVRETVMEPEFRQGEHVLVDLSDQKPSPPGVFIISDGFGNMIRHCAYVPKTSPAKVTISAKTSEFESHTLSIDDFKIIGRVIAKLRMV